MTSFDCLLYGRVIIRKKCDRQVKRNNLYDGKFPMDSERPIDDDTEIITTYVLDDDKIISI